MANIAFYGSHNAAYVVESEGEIKLVLEAERFLNYKNAGIAQYMCPKTSEILFFAEYIPQWIMKKLGITEFENCFYSNSDVIMDNVRFNLQKAIPAKNYIESKHHLSHAAGSFYQSSYDEALIFSFDGGGNDGKFCVYTCKRGESPKLLEAVINPKYNNPHIHYDLGFPYMVIAHYLKDIKHEDLGLGNLVYPGKLMGLASYGTPISTWLPHFMNFYKDNPEGKDYQEKIKVLGENIGVTFDVSNRIEGELAYNLAATNQLAFEESFLEIAKPYLEKYPNLPVCITGGCGLNIILNTRLIEDFLRDVHVGPDPNDCGIALGMMLNYLKPNKPYDATYSGTQLLDLDNLASHVQGVGIPTKTRKVNIEKLAADIELGKIVGVARGRSEHGPRALGNRSILCNPMIPDMKEVLNEKVKHREWYRPFAPIVRLEDVNKYFEWDKESRWMSFCPKVRKEWKEALPAITHIDGTARVQTVTRDQNPWIYDLLTAFEKLTGVGVLLNTSFNVDGKPILSTVKDAFIILEATKLDALVIEDYYIKKG
jgi:predicted NodU family carbamoyl transferase